MKKWNPTDGSGDDVRRGSLLLRRLEDRIGSLHSLLGFRNLNQPVTLKSNHPHSQFSANLSSSEGHGDRLVLPVLEELKERLGRDETAVVDVVEAARGVGTPAAPAESLQGRERVSLSVSVHSKEVMRKRGDGTVRTAT
jgi:hypothetical protein